MVKTRKLTKDIVVETAARLVNDAGSFEAISLAQLAQELDIRVPSLYNHVDGLEGLRYALTLHAAREFDRYLNEAIQGKSGREALVAMTAMYRQLVRDHPGLYPLIVKASHADDEELAGITNQSVNTIILVFNSVGITGDQALHAIRGFRSLLHGFVSLEQAGGFRLPLDLDHSFTFLTNMYIDALDQITEK